MSTIVVWVLMVGSTHSWFEPSIEFTTEAKCIAAVQQMQAEVRKRNNWFNGFCMRIEK